MAVIRQRKEAETVRVVHSSTGREEDLGDLPIVMACAIAIMTTNLRLWLFIMMRYRPVIDDAFGVRLRAAYSFLRRQQ